MKTLIFVISIILLIGMVLSPVLLFIKLRDSRLSFLKYLILGLIITLGITLTFAWSVHYSNKLLLVQYEYDLNAMSDIERYGNIKNENLEEVKHIETSLFGIGWQLKAIMTYVFYFPYLLIVYLIGREIKKMKINLK